MARINWYWKSCPRVASRRHSATSCRGDARTRASAKWETSEPLYTPPFGFATMGSGSQRRADAEAEPQRGNSKPSPVAANIERGFCHS